VGTETGERVFVASVNANGVLDNTFGYRGRVTFLATDTDQVIDAAADATGRLILIRKEPTPITVPATSPQYYFQRYNLDGSQDTSIGSNGREDLPAAGLIPTDILFASNGDIYMGSLFTNTFSTVSGAFILRFSGANGNFLNAAAVGAVNPGATSIDDTSMVLAEDDQGRLLVATTSEILTGTIATATLDIDRFSLALVADTTFNFTLNTTGQNAVLSDLVLQPDGKILASFNAISVQPAGSAPTILRLNPDGQLDVTFDNDGIFRPTFSGRADGGAQLLQMPDGRLLMGLPLKPANTTSPPTLLLSMYFVGTTPPTGREDDLYLFNPDNGQLTVQVSDGTGQGFTSQLVATITGTNFSNALTGDFDGDSRLDFAVRGNVSTNRVGRWLVYQSSTGTVVDWGNWSTAQTWSRVAVGDFDANGFDDIIGQTATGHWWVALSNGTRFVNEFFGRWEPNGWVGFRYGDFTGDGKTDILGVLNSGAVMLGISTGNHFQIRFRGTLTGIATVRQIVAGDFDGDNVDEIAALDTTGLWRLGELGTNSRIQVTNMTQWTGANLAIPVVTGDFNGDGRTDILGAATSSSWLMVQGNGTTFQTIDFFGVVPLSASTRPVVGDFNGDGLDDVATFNLGTDTFHTSLSNGTFFLQHRIGTIPGLDGDFALGAGEIVP
jgi:hypothetical protein